MADLLSNISDKVVNFVVDQAAREVGYLIFYKCNFKEFQNKAKDLQNARGRVQHKIDHAKKNAQEIEADVVDWLNKVDMAISENDKFLGDQDHKKTGCNCTSGSFPNLLMMFKLGRKAKKMTQDIEALLLQKDKLEGVSFWLGLGQTWVDTAFSTTASYRSFKTRDETIDKIMGAMRDSSVRMVGVYGLGGVGKTTLVKQIARKVQETSLFSVVIMANITRNPDLRRIQGQIADMLGMTLEEESVIGRASHIHKRLKEEEENTLVILDDLWDELDLNLLGIPFDGGGGGNLNQKNVNLNKQRKPMSDDFIGCKVLLTSRSKQVLCDQITGVNANANPVFPLEVLKEKEALELFKNVAGLMLANNKDSSDFDKLASKIASKCGGLPIAIVTVGTALKNKAFSVWEDVHQQLERHSFTGVHNAIEFSTRLSYDQLEDEELKSVILLCAQMSHDSLTGELLKYCIGLGIFQGVYTVKEAKDRLQSIIIKLKASSLLLDSYSNDRFTMHDIVRDSVLSIASKDHHVFSMRNGKLDEWPDANKLMRYNVVSLHYCDIIGDLPECLNCPKLKVFHVDSKDPSLKIPNNFFKRMRELKVLILTGFDLSLLPSSIRHLKGLRMLCMEQCVIGDCSVIGELKNLRVLSLSGSFIESLPNELCKLGMLQMFDITNCSKLSVIPPRIISSLNNLEEFYVRNNLVQWDQSEENASLSELRHLYQLITLDVQIPSIDPWPKDLFFDNLENYKIVIGEFDTLSMGDFKVSHQMYESSRVLALQLKEGFNIHSQKGIKMLFKRVESLLLGELNDVHDVLYELNFEGFPSLKHLAIANNTGIQYIHRSTERLHPVEAFPNLESMNLCKIWNMEEICCCQLSDASFRNLKSIKIETCVRLKNLFSFSIAKLLRELETIEVFDCDSLEKIVSMESQGSSNDDHAKDDNVEFPRLRYLILRSLPAFASFYTKSQIPLASQSEENQGQNEYQLAPEDELGVSSFSLFNEMVSIPKLETLEMFSIDHIRKIWCDQSLPSHCFQNLKKLNVTDCSNLKYLLSFSMARNLVNLQTLFVSKCEMMEDILSMHDAEMIDIFPKLKKIQITCMEKLNTIWHAQLGSTSFQNLETLIIKECNKLVNIFPSYMVGKYQSLQALEVVNCRSMEHIFDLEHVPPSQVTHGRLNETRLQYICLGRLAKLKNVWKLGNTKNIIIEFNNLRYVAFDRCFAMETIFPTCVAIGLKKLEYLYVLYCPLMKDIVAMDEGSTSQNTITFEFPRLSYLSLQMLLEFRSFYWGMHILEWPALKEFYLFHCYKLEAMNLQVKPIFLAVEKVISNLEVLGISPKEAKWLQDYMGNNYRMQKLRRLCFDGLKSTEIIFWFLYRMPNLEALELIDCRFKEIWPHDDQNLTMHANIGTIVQLKALELCKLPYLQNIGFEHDLVVQRVESIILQSCPNLVKFVPHSSVSFNHLKHLEVSECDKLMNLMAPSTAKSLVHLTTMKVRECELMEEIIINNDDEEKNREEIIVFRQLTTLELVCLSSLTCFCSSENCHFMFPSLEKMVVRECPRMKMMSRGVKNTPKLHKVCAEEKRWYWEGDVNATIEKIFSRMDSFEYSKHLILSVHPELEQVWHGQVDLPHNCFRNLKTLIVAHSGYVRDYVIPSHLLYYLKNMEELQVRNCTQVKVIFDINDKGMMSKTKEIASHLRNLRLEKLPNLKTVWNRNPQGLQAQVVKFQDLREVDVTSCKSLRSLFPSYLAKNLRQLRSLKIATCDDLVEIVGTEEEEDDVQGGIVTQKFEFPCLTSLTLYYLPQLDCFYRGTHIMNCPSLQNLYVGFCDKLQMFTTKHTSSHQEAYPKDEIGVSTYYRQPLFLVEEVIPKLEKLSLNQKDIMILRDGQFSSDLLHKLDTLRLYFDTNNEVAAKTTSSLLFELLLKAPYIECLVLASAGLNQIIFPASQVDDDDHNRFLLLQLKKLVLNSISGLSSIASKDDHTWLSLVLERLQILHIFSCPSMMKLVDNSTTFSSLERLIIRRCHNLEYLFTSSTAKGLEHLLSLEIQDCESIKVVVAEEEEEEVKECCKITFGWLSLLQLESLPNLERFYSGNNNATLEFSYLEKVIIDKCPTMKTFSQGVTIAPNFYAMQASSDPNDLHLLEDLNTTVQMVFRQRVEHLILGDHPELEELWQYGGVVPIQNGCFSNLKSLVVKGCGFLSNSVIPFHLLPFLSNLEELKVEECDSVTSIFDMKGIIPINQIFSLRLKKLVLGQLHNLEHVWNDDPKGILSLQFLHQVCVNGCGSITSLFPASVAIDKLEKLEVVQCERFVEIVAKYEEDADINEGESQEFVFHNLNSLTLWDLPELKCFYPGKHKLEWPKLIELNVYHCAKLNIFQSELQSHHEAGLEDQQAIVSAEKVFPNLKQLSLSSEHMMLICDGMFEDSLLHSIKYLRLMCFHNNDHEKETIFPCQILHKVPNIEKLQVGCGDLIKEIFCSQSPINDHHQDHTAILTILSKLKSLVLDSLPNLNSIGFEHSWLHPSFFPKSLETLKVIECSSLMNLVPSSKVSFSNLMDLTVASCDGMVNLFTSSTAKTLTLLKNMSIRDCRSMQEIVANTEEDENNHEDEIIMFKKLEALTLHSLTSLECFYSGSLKMEFPLLGKLSILHCSRMKFFCQSENDLNAIIKKNYEKEAASLMS